MFRGSQNGDYELDVASAQIASVVPVGQQKLVAHTAWTYAPSLQYDWIRVGDIWRNRGHLGSAYDVTGVSSPVALGDKPGYTFPGALDYFPCPAVAEPMNYFGFWFYAPVEYTSITPFNILGSHLAAASFIGLGNTTGGGLETVRMSEVATGRATQINDVITLGNHKLEYVWDAVALKYLVLLDNVERTSYAPAPGHVQLAPAYQLTLGRYVGTANYFTGRLYSVTTLNYSPTKEQLSLVFNDERNLYGI
ncbi:MAG: hypothetical protein KKB59_20195 [Spirochaetes bacterium]|nr:hypothetical protein [Spirochaetota bacterium]